MKIRLQRALAQAGVASRREAEGYIARGEVSVNGRTAVLGESVDPESDSIFVRGVPLPRPAGRKRYVAWNKPPGIVTSLRSTHGETVVGDLLDTGSRLFPVGRLDKESGGLLLLTDDGEWANLVMHPRYGIEKEYVARVRGLPPSEALHRMEAGITMPDGSITSPAKVRRIGHNGGDATLGITVIEGKKRQIRLMAAAVGHPVVELLRVRIGPVRLGRMKSGEWRDLTRDEVEGIRDAEGRGRTSRSSKSGPAGGS